MTSDLTPMMRQYLQIKGELKDTILFFRLGDFYEMFFDDAREATRILHITLTSREAGKGNKVPMCGVPHHAAKNYIARLVKHGRKVAICEQVEEPGPGKKLVRREVTKIITPGTFMADELLGGAINNYILSLNVREGNFGLAYADISTGEFRVTETGSREDLFSELYKISPAECLVPESFSREKGFGDLRDVNLGVLTVDEDWMFDYDLSLKEIKNHFSVDTLEGFGCEEMSLAVGAAGALLRYLKNTQKNHLSNIGTISAYHASQFMTMDRNSHRNLELIQNIEDLTSNGTLFGVLDLTRTPMGKRRLKNWILNPLLNTKEIKMRLDVVQYFFDNGTTRLNVREVLGEVYDIERLSNRISLETANARDMIALASSLENVGALKEVLKGTLVPKLKDITRGLGDFSDVIKSIRDSIADEPPVAVRDGGIIKKGYDAGIDELRDLISGGRDWLAELQEREIKRTGIGSLKVGYNKVFGYFIEVTKANLGAVPEDYIRKQTLVNAERFITQELKDYETKIIGAEERVKNKEYEVFCALRKEVGAEIERLKKAASGVADLDALSDLAEVAVKNHYTRPQVDDGDSLRVVEGRHPVLEKILKDKEFVPNDVTMDTRDHRIFVITGSNMAGKSTYIRQIALITIMAQVGSFVPAKSAKIGVVDRIFTRVGASDRLYRGMSTFMVEMLETANILNNATGRSLIILDEIGRGTSTFDGVSIAWAAVEFLWSKRPGAKALFATHFHELTELSEIMRGIKNYHLAVQEWGDEVAFLYKVEEGSCDESFGIHVAKLAGMPQEVVARARDILNNLQKDSLMGNIRSRFSEKDGGKEKQLDFFGGYSAGPPPVVKKLKDLDVDNLTPLEALKRLAELKDKVSEN